VEIKGLQTLTLLDFPGHVACTVFTGGCNFHCPFCHNASLVTAPGSLPSVEEAEFFRFLERRRGILDGVAITGGEPMLWADLPDFLLRIRALGYAVKLDTNGSYPERLRDVINRGLVDYVAMDIKNSPEKYRLTAGADFLGPVQHSVELLLEGRVPFEFRTTAVKELHTAADFSAIGRWIKGAPRYFIQMFKDSGDILERGMSAPDETAMQAFLEAAREFVPEAALRGVN